jgi:hypothetical protein
MNRPAAAYRLVNIGPLGRKKRLRMGLIAIGLGAGLAVLVSFTFAAPAYRLYLLPLFWFGALSVFQALDRVCVVLASRGQRDFDDGAEPIGNVGEMKAIRRRARAVHIKALIAAAGLTVLSFFV